MKNYQQVAASVAQAKERHPELFCPATRCLWRTGGGYCPRHKPASWILREKETGAVICETFDPAKVAALNTAKYEAVPILQYLQELNAKIKKGKS
jgi:hypothetical protein